MSLLYSAKRVHTVSCTKDKSEQLSFSLNQSIDISVGNQRQFHSVQNSCSDYIKDVILEGR